MRTRRTTTRKTPKHGAGKGRATLHHNEMVAIKAHRFGLLSGTSSSQSYNKARMNRVRNVAGQKGIQKSYPLPGLMSGGGWAKLRKGLLR